MSSSVTARGRARAPLAAALVALAVAHAAPCSAQAQAALPAFVPAPAPVAASAAPPVDLRAPCAQAARGALAARILDPVGLGAEPELLAALRDAEREALPSAGSLSEALERSRAALPVGLDAEFVARLAPSPLAGRLGARVLAALALYRSEPRAQRALRGWVRRAGRYRARLEAILASEGVPAELLWVAAAESSFNPNDVSSVGAAGLWQLMPQTARTYGLRVDAWVDERRDPDRATRAAARYLRELHARLGSWELALAAYNMGYSAVLRAVRRYNTNDFDALAGLEAGLPYETVHYVPRIIAASIAARAPAAFGLDAVEPDAPLRWVDVPLSRSLPLDATARALGVAPEALRALNPALRGARTPVVPTGSTFALHAPAGTAVDDALARLSSVRTPAFREYALRYGEALDEVAARYGLRAGDLLGLSGLATESRAVAGTTLLVPDREPAPAPRGPRPTVALATPAEPPPTDARRVFYRVGYGDELSAVAQALGVARERLLRWNALDETARLLPGLWLQAWLPAQGDGAAPSARVFELDEVELLVPGSERFHERVVAAEGHTRLRVTVREGDTMASLARRYGVTVGSLARINHRSRHATLAPGEELVVYAAEAEATAGSERGAPVEPAQRGDVPAEQVDERPAEAPAARVPASAPAPASPSGSGAVAVNEAPAAAVSREATAEPARGP